MFEVLVWLHVLCMVGTFGGLLAVQLVVPAATRNTPQVAKGAARLFSILISIGLVAGILVYVKAAGMGNGRNYNMIIGIKFVILLVVGALLGISARSGIANVLRTLAMIFLAIAALLGTSL